MKKILLKVFKNFATLSVIVALSFSNIPFDFLTGMIGGYVKTSNIVDHAWQLSQEDNVVDNFVSSYRNKNIALLDKLAGNLKIKEAHAATSYVGGVTCSRAGSTGTNLTCSLTALTGGSNASPSQNDIVIAVVSTGSTADRAIGVTNVGYTELPELYANGTTNDTNLSVSWKIMGATPDTSVTFGPSGSTADAISAVVHVWRGVNTGTPFDVTNQSITGTATGRPNPPPITPVTSGATVIAIGAGAAGTGAVYTAAGLANFRTVASVDTYDSMTGMGSFAWSSGTYDSAQWTGGTANAADSWASYTLALRPLVAVTTISDFVTSEPVDSTIAPATSVLVDSFGLVTNSGTDTVTAATVGLAAGMGQYIQTVAITNNGDTVTYCSATPSGDSASLSTCGIPVSTTDTQFKIKLTAKSHASMPVPPGGSYAVAASITGFTSTNGQSGIDTASATVTIDNASPNGVTSVGGTAGNAANTINWTTSNSADFNTTNGSVVYRWAAGAAGSETPTEGATPTLGSTNGTATVACLVSSAASAAQSKTDGSGGSADCTTTALTNGQAYTYKAFQRDTNGNYDVGVLIGTFTPSAPASTLTISASAGSKVANVDSGATSQFVHDISCTTDGTCAAFKLAAAGGPVNVTSITVTETNASLNADIDLANAALIYDTDANYSNGTAGTFGTDATFASQAVTFTNAGLNIPNGSTYYFYIRTDLANGTARPDGGLTMNFSIANATDVVSDGTESGTATLAGTTTIRPNVTSVTYPITSPLNGARLGQSGTTITGAGFGTTCDGTNNKVMIGSAVVNCAQMTFSDTSITINNNWTYSSGDSYGGATTLLATIGGTADDLSKDFYVYPTVSGVIDPTAYIDAAREYSASDSDGVVTINGNHFGTAQGSGSVTVLGQTATIVSWGATAIQIQVPATISDSSYAGSIVVYQGTGGNSSASDTYGGGTYRILPRVTGLSSASGVIGDNITVNGNHFCQTGTCPGSPFTASNNVLFGATNASAPDTWSWSHTGINAKAPSGSGTVAVKAVSNDYDSNTTNFTYVSTAPGAPTTLQQFRSNGVTEITVGGGTNDTPTQAKMEGDFTAETSITAFLEVEVKPKASAFDGTTNIFTSSPSTGSTFSNMLVSISGLSDGDYHWRARAKNQTTSETSSWVTFGSNPAGDGSTDGSPANVDFAVDTTAPVISGTCIVSPTSSSCDGTSQTDIQAQIRWATDENASRQVAYQTGACGTGADATAVFNSMTSKEPSSPTGSATAHNAILSGLTPVTTYYYKLRAADAFGTISYSPAGTTCDSFQTDPAQTRVMKTLEFFIDQNTAVGGTLNKAFDVFISESKQDRSNIYIKSVSIDIFGVSVGDGAGDISVAATLNGGGNQTYTLSDPGNGVASSWRTTYATSSLSFDCAYCTTHPSNTLNVSVTGPTNTSLLGAKASVTYYYEPL